MRLGLFLPKLMEQMSLALVESVHGEAGRPMKSGEKVFDVTVDLGGVLVQNCPPISHYRLVLREGAVLARVLAIPGEEVEAGACLAVFTTEAEEVAEGPVERPVRIAAAAILSHLGMWSVRRPSGG
jgi:hypothetical protein